MPLNIGCENRENSVTSYSIEEDDQVSLAKSSVQNSGRATSTTGPRVRCEMVVASARVGSINKN